MWYKWNFKTLIFDKILIIVLKDIQLPNKNLTYLNISQKETAEFSLI